MKYGITSEISRDAYETDRDTIEKIMRDQVIWQAAKQGLRQTGKISCRWEQYPGDLSMMLLFTSTECHE